MKARLRKIFTLSVAALLAVILVEHGVQCLEEHRLVADQKLVSVGDNSVRYELHPAVNGVQGPVIVMLNGMAASIEAWRLVTLPLSQAYPVLTYDRNGVGLSGPSDVATADEQVDELWGLLDALELKAPVVLVSYSFSASMARVFAERYPERTAGVVLLDPFLGECDLKRTDKPSPARYYARPVGGMLLRTMFGIHRIRNLLFRDSPESPEEKREEFILRRNWHWLAVAREAWEGREQTIRAMKSNNLGAIPLAVLCGTGDDGHFDPLYDGACHQVAGQSTAGEFVALPKVEHSQLLAEPMGINFLVSQIRRVAERSQGAAPP